MRDRSRVLANLESLYKDAYEAAASDGDEALMKKLDFDFQRDQLYFEVLLDVRDTMGAPPEEEAASSSLLEKAQKIRRLTKGIK